MDYSGYSEYESDLMGTDIDDMLDNAEYMGYDIELLGKNIFRRIADRIKKRIAERKNRKLSVSTDRGSVSLTDAGLNITNTPSGGPGGQFTANQQGFQYQQTPVQSGVMGQIAKNPLLLAIPAGALMFMAMQNKK